MDSIQKVTIIGSGNLAANLAIALYKREIEITQVYSRSIINAKNLTNKVNAEAIDNLDNIKEETDLIILSVTDSVYSDVLGKIPFRNIPVVHTAGSIPIDIFADKFDYYGVFYPFQTFSKERIIGFKNIPISIESNSSLLLEKLKQLGSLVSNRVIELNSEKRKKLHLTGIMANNFSNFLFTLSGDFLEKQGLDFEILLPLIEETVEKLKHLSPKQAQTGPAARGNKNVIEKHKELLKDNQQLLAIYSLLSENILTYYGNT
jgi:predicted short-subunit dehydrogenase-like oxidoreductase (DUF2520 family)